jgi:hypothetical protein
MTSAGHGTEKENGPASSGVRTGEQVAQGFVHD